MATQLYAWSAEQRASRACIRHFINEAIERKQWASSVDEKWLKRASFVSQKWVNELRRQSVHELARGTLEYCRMRSRMRVYGSYPADKSAFDLWARLNPIAAAISS